MQQAYKIEFFDRQLAFLDYRPLPVPTVSMDYLTLEPTSVAVPHLTVPRGSFAHITDLSGTVVYQGIVDDVQAGQGLDTLRLLPLLSLLDIEVAIPAGGLGDATLEQFLAGLITAAYGDSGDPLQDLPGLTVRTGSETTGAVLDLSARVQSLWGLCTRALTLYGVMVDLTFDPAGRTLTATIGRTAGEPVTLEADLPNCITRSLTLSDTYGALNKMTYLKAGSSQQVTYYLHTDGSVSTEDADRITPVFFGVEELDSDDFADEAHSLAVEALTPQRYEQLIELGYAASDPLVRPLELAIGTPTRILYQGAVYDSVLTGYEDSGGIRTLSFGAVRLELTKKLILERRSR